MSHILFGNSWNSIFLIRSLGAVSALIFHQRPAFGDRPRGWFHYRSVNTGKKEGIFNIAWISEAALGFFFFFFLRRKFQTTNRQACGKEVRSCLHSSLAANPHVLPPAVPVIPSRGCAMSVLCVGYGGFIEGRGNQVLFCHLDSWKILTGKFFSQAVKLWQTCDSGAHSNKLGNKSLWPRKWNDFRCIFPSY